MQAIIPNRHDLDRKTNVGNDKYVLSSSLFSSALGLEGMGRKQAWRIETGKEEFGQGYERGMLAWGKQSEDEMIWSVNVRTGWLFADTGEDQISYFDKNEHFRTTPDGACLYNGDQAICLEGKCPTLKRKAPLTPVDAMPQLQAHMQIGNFEGCIFAVWEPKVEVKCWRVYPSYEYWLAMVTTLEAFRRYVIEDTEPPRFSAKLNPKPLLPECEVKKI